MQGKTSFKQIVVTTTVAVAFAGAALAEPVKEGSALPAAAKASVEETVAARVNGRPIYLKDVNASVVRTLNRVLKFGGGDETRKQALQQELDRQVNVELMVQAGEKLLGQGVEKKLEEKVQAQLATLTTRNQTGNGNKNRITVSDETRQRIRRQLLMEEYLTTRGLYQLQVSEAELKKYYEENREKFREPETVKVSHVLIALPKDPKPEEVEKARKQIEKVREELRNGKEFAELAKTYSACDSAKAGGDLGYLRHDVMPKAFDQVAFNLKPGEVSDIVRTRLGFHLIKGFDKKPSHIADFAEIKPLLQKFLLRWFQDRKIAEIAQELRKDAKIEIAVN
jgi:peptidyl-prolyl cis-trans isomerase C